MLFNQTVLYLKQRYLDSTPLDLIRRVAENLAGGNAKIDEVSRQWTPGGGSQNFIVSLDGRQWFVKAKHKSLLVESALESENSFSSMPALENEYSFLCELAASPHVPQALGFIEQDDYMFLATEVLRPFDVITSFDPPQIVDAFEQLTDFTRNLYEKGIVHTDIHEKNVCFRGNVPVLIDFEEARYVRQSVCFEDSLDVSGASGIDNVGEFPALKPDSVKGFTCLNRLREVFKNILRPKLPNYLAQCNFDCSSAFNLDTEQQPDSRIYQSVTLPDITIVGQRPVHDARLDYVHLALSYAEAVLGRKLDVVDLGANMGMVAFSCAAAPGVHSVVGLEADPRYVEASKVLAFYTDSPASVIFEEYMTGNRPYVWNTDVLLMLSVYHHVADKDAFLQELAAQKIVCILGEFAVQERYYPQRGSVKAEIEHIRKALGFKYAEYLAISDDYQRPLVAFHNGPQSSILHGLKRQSVLTESLPPDCKGSADKALAWVRAHSAKGGGICVSHQNTVLYPEVTGYFIPTLLQWGEKDLAVEYARWLMSIQRPDGSFSGPGIAAPFAFDTGQVIRGLAAISSVMPEAVPALEKACQWIVRTASPEGRLALPDDMGAWSLGPRGYVNEAIHLYVLPGLLAAGEVLNTSRYGVFTRRSLDYYIQHCNLTNFLAPNMLLHFYCYIQEALFDLGADDICRNGMKCLAEHQVDSGLVPAYAGESWVCTPGLIQAGLVWCKLQEVERGRAALRFARSLQRPSGGFLGGVGDGATYFPDEELSWPIKFWLDALALQNAGQAAPAQGMAQRVETFPASEYSPRVLSENEIPVIDLESAAIGELERSCLKASAGCTSGADVSVLDGVASAIPVLLDWGRRSLALSAATHLAEAIEDWSERHDKAWEAPGEVFFLARLIRAFRQPEVLRVHGDAVLKLLCLKVLRRQRQTAAECYGLFSCFNELREAGLTLHEQSWVDCAEHWAGLQGGLLDQSATPELVWDSVGAGQLLGAETGMALLRRVAASIGGMAQNKPAFRREYALMALTLAWGAWTLGDDDLGRAAYCQGVSALLEKSGTEAGFQGDAPVCQAFLNALRAMQACRFATSFPHFLDDIAPDDGRLLFVEHHLPRSADSRVLDMGTAKGRYLRRLHHAKATGKLVGQDVHPAFARFMPKGVETGVGTVLRSGWQDEVFDAVLLCEVLEHCIDLPAALKELHRILVDGGTLIIIDKNVQRLASWPGGIPAWEQWFDCEKLAGILRSNGFVVENIEKDVFYEGRRDGLFFGLAAQKGRAAGLEVSEEALPASTERPYGVFDPRTCLGDSLGLVFYTAVAEALLQGNADVEMGLYAKYLSHFPLEAEHSPEIFMRLVKSMAASGYDYMYPVSALPQAFTFSNGVHRMATAIALGIRDVPYLYTPSNNVSQVQAIQKIFSATEFRWIMAQQRRLVSELPQDLRLLCQLRSFIVSKLESFRDAPFSSATPVQGCVLSYQGLEKVGLTGKRSAEKRFRIYRLARYLTQDMDVLETGCNCGFLSWLTAQHVRQVDAFDVDANYIELGRMLQNEYGTKNLHYSVSRFEDFNTAKQYDAIISCAVYGWVPISFAAFVDRLDRWLKPGGILLFESHELIVHPEWKQQRAFLTNRYELLHADYIDDVDHAFYASEYREFLVLRKK